MDTAPLPDARPLDAPSNVPEYTVSEISGAVKRTLEGAFGRVRVRGEITEYKKYPSGHMYFALKDEGGKISGVVWKSAVSKLGLVPENGVEVIATGRVSSYGDRSTYQLVVERMEYAGAGALLAKIELLRLRLLAEGLFDADRKRPLPMLPEVVGVVTSASGAVLHDIRTTMARRFPRRLLIWPVPVQGEGAAAKIAAAILGFEAIVEGGLVPRPAVLIVARGGGSLEDLMAFNDEAVIRAVAACRIPVIAAVGHETDHTLIDLVADRRAPTPTAAAEMAVPSRADLVATMAQEGARLIGGLQRLLGELRLRLGRAERGLPDLPGAVESARQKTDDRGQRLVLALPNLLLARRARLAQVERLIPDLPAILRSAREAVMSRGRRLLVALPNLVGQRRGAFGAVHRVGPHAVVAGAQGALRLAAAALGHGFRQSIARDQDLLGRARLSPAPLQGSIREQRARLEGLTGRLESVSYSAVLARGYAVVLDPGGHTVVSAAAVPPGSRLDLRFADGDVRVTADGRARTPARPAGSQGALF